MPLSLQLCFIVSLFVGINGIKFIQKHYGEDFTETRLSQKSNKEFLQCLQNLFDELFTTCQEEDIESKDAIMTEKFYKNTDCITKSINSSETLVRLFGKFLDGITKLKMLETKEKTKAQKTLYKMALQIANEFRKDEEILPKLRETITSFLEQTQLPDPTDPNDELSQFLSRSLIGCLAYHFNATFQFHLRKEIKQQDKILQIFLRWNSGCIAISEQSSKRVIFYLAKVFNQLLNLSPRGSRREQKKFNSNIKGILDEFGYIIGENATVTGHRTLISRIDKIEYPEPKDPEIKITRSTFDGIPVIIQEPVKPSSKLRTGLMFFHGGGWAYRDAERYLRQTVYLAKNLDAVVVSVEYRRSPEYKFPGSINDCLKATEYFLKNARRFKVDPQRIAVSGDSAGGNMATSISLKLRDDNKRRKPKIQVLIYPGLQLFDFNLPSHQQNEKMIGLSKNEAVNLLLMYTNLNASFKEAVYKNKHICDDMKHSTEASYIDINVIPDEYKKNYTRVEVECDPIVAEAVKEKMLNPYIFPLMSHDLSKLPPALIINAEFDILRDEGLMYGARLRSFGIPLEEHIIKGGYHGAIDWLDWVDVAKEIMDIIVNYLKENL